MVAHWEGPMTVVIYLADAEVPSLHKLILRSNILGRRHNIAYHLVYKRHVSIVRVEYVYSLPLVTAQFAPVMHCHSVDSP